MSRTAHGCGGLAGLIAVAVIPCENCDGYELTLGSGGHVWFTGLAGCAVPGSHHNRIPATDFDAGTLVLTYRDRARIHEVEDWGRDDPGLPDRYLSPSPQLYAELLRGRKDVNAMNENGPNASRSLALCSAAIDAAGPPEGGHYGPTIAARGVGSRGSRYLVGAGRLGRRGQAQRAAHWDSRSDTSNT